MKVATFKDEMGYERKMCFNPEMSDAEITMFLVHRYGIRISTPIISMVEAQ